MKNNTTWNIARGLLFSGSTAFFLLANTALAVAQEGGGASTSVAAQETTIHGGTLVIIVYFVLFAMLTAYGVWLMRRQSKIQEEITEIEKRIDTLLGQD